MLISIWAGRLLKKWKIQITLPESQFHPFNLHSEVSGFPENGLDDHHHNHQHHQHHHHHDLEVVRKTCTQWPFLREPNTSLTPHSLSMHSAQQYKRILCTATDINWWHDTKPGAMVQCTEDILSPSGKPNRQLRVGKKLKKKWGGWGRATVTITLNFSTLIYFTSTFIHLTPFVPVVPLIRWELNFYFHVDFWLKQTHRNIKPLRFNVFMRLII